ncbi:hypothetical protein V7128_19570, partial [Neobacillus vireti]|uniref:hypothetical protein n=1 Tax=Neobacillus vireti TaxID=220686 RepID=UPI002FFE6C4F
EGLSVPSHFGAGFFVDLFIVEKPLQLPHFFPIHIVTTALASGAFKRVKVGKLIIRINGIPSALTIWAFALVFHIGDMILISSLFPLIK